MTRLGSTIAWVWLAGCAAPQAEARIRVTLNSPSAVTSLANPSLGRIAKAYGFKVAKRVERNAEHPPQL